MLVAPALVSTGITAVTLHTALVLGLIVAVLVVIILLVAEFVHLARFIVAGAGRTVAMTTGFFGLFRREMLAARRLVMVTQFVRFFIGLAIVAAVGVPFRFSHVSSFPF